MATIRRFEDVDAWQKAREYVHGEEAEKDVSSSLIRRGGWGFVIERLG